MAKTIRLNDREEKELNDLALRLNRELVRMGKMPWKDTELFHKIINEAMIEGQVELSGKGEKIVLIR